MSFNFIEIFFFFNIFNFLASVFVDTLSAKYIINFVSSNVLAISYYQINSVQVITNNIIFSFYFFLYIHIKKKY